MAAQRAMSRRPPDFHEVDEPPHYAPAQRAMSRRPPEFQDVDEPPHYAPAQRAMSRRPPEYQDVDEPPHYAQARHPPQVVRRPNYPQAPAHPEPAPRAHSYALQEQKARNMTSRRPSNSYGHEYPRSEPAAYGSQFRAARPPSPPHHDGSGFHRPPSPGPAYEPPPTRRGRSRSPFDERIAQRPRRSSTSPHVSAGRDTSGVYVRAPSHAAPPHARPDMHGRPADRNGVSIRAPSRAPSSYMRDRPVHDEGAHFERRDRPPQPTGPYRSHEYERPVEYQGPPVDDGRASMSVRRPITAGHELEGHGEYQRRYESGPAYDDAERERIAVRRPTISREYVDDRDGREAYNVRYDVDRGPHRPAAHGPSAREYEGHERRDAYYEERGREHASSVPRQRRDSEYDGPDMRYDERPREDRGERALHLSHSRGYERPPERDGPLDNGGRQYEYENAHSGRTQPPMRHHVAPSYEPDGRRESYERAPTRPYVDEARSPVRRATYEGGPNGYDGRYVDEMRRQSNKHGERGYSPALRPEGAEYDGLDRRHSKYVEDVEGRYYADERRGRSPRPSSRGRDYDDWYHDESARRYDGERREREHVDDREHGDRYRNHGRDASFDSECEYCNRGDHSDHSDRSDRSDRSERSEYWEYRSRRSPSRSSEYDRSDRRRKRSGSYHRDVHREYRPRSRSRSPSWEEPHGDGRHDAYGSRDTVQRSVGHHRAAERGRYDGEHREYQQRRPSQSHRPDEGREVDVGRGRTPVRRDYRVSTDGNGAPTQHEGRVAYQQRQRASSRSENGSAPRRPAAATASAQERPVRAAPAQKTRREDGDSSDSSGSTIDSRSGTTSESRKSPSDSSEDSTDQRRSLVGPVSRERTPVRWRSRSRSPSRSIAPPTIARIRSLSPLPSPRGTPEAAPHRRRTAAPAADSSVTRALTFPSALVQGVRAEVPLDVGADSHGEVKSTVGACVQSVDAAIDLFSLPPAAMPTDGVLASGDGERHEPTGAAEGRVVRAVADIDPSTVANDGGANSPSSWSLRPSSAVMSERDFDKDTLADWIGGEDTSAAPSVTYWSPPRDVDGEGLACAEQPSAPVDADGRDVEKGDAMAVVPVAREYPWRPTSPDALSEASL